MRAPIDTSAKPRSGFDQNVGLREGTAMIRTHLGDRRSLFATGRGAPAATARVTA